VRGRFEWRIVFDRRNAFEWGIIFKWLALFEWCNVFQWGVIFKWLALFDWRNAFQWSAVFEWHAVYAAAAVNRQLAVLGIPAKSRDFFAESPSKTKDDRSLPGLPERWPVRSVGEKHVPSLRREARLRSG
jgi:hypothetical protein